MFRTPARAIIPAVLMSAGLAFGIASPASAETPTLSVVSHNTDRCVGVPPLISCSSALSSWTFNARIDRQVLTVTSRDRVWVQYGPLILDTTRATTNTSENNFTWSVPSDVQYTSQTATEDVGFMWKVNGIVHSLSTGKTATGSGFQG